MTLEPFLNSVETIVYLGPGGSYTEMAKDIFCKKYEIKCYQKSMKTIKSVLEFIDENPRTVGVLPIENSIEGTVRETIDNIINTRNKNIKILSEILTPINHCLLSRTTEFSSISTIISHSQALAQCRTFVHNEMPFNSNIIEVASTAEAARKLQDYNLTYAAIGSEKTAEIYNLNILKCNINDDPNNKTRFALIGDFETPKVKNGVTTIAFSTRNKPGALLDILQIFQHYGINLSYIDSRPSKVKFGEYTFFIDIDGHILNKIVTIAVNEVKSQVHYYRLIGSFERW